MVNIEELRNRFKAAEEKLDEVDEQREDFAVRLTGLMTKIETVLQNYQDENQAQEGENSRLVQENQELHEMLTRLLSAVETKHLNGTLADLGAKLRSFELLPENAEPDSEIHSDAATGSLGQALAFNEVLDSGAEVALEVATEVNETESAPKNSPNGPDCIFPRPEDGKSRTAEEVVQRVTELVRGLSDSETNRDHPSSEK